MKSSVSINLASPSSPFLPNKFRVCGLLLTETFNWRATILSFFTFGSLDSVISLAEGANSAITKLEEPNEYKDLVFYGQ